ncbi:MAG: DUF2971 domain-containing protein [Caldilineaceae bacterium]|nr:DUF2971 domain-containing protein [Caldilineaceae bacterium]
MTEVYRFRSTRRLICGDTSELERQTIFFASPEQLNDPMEGLRDLVWRGDEIVWTNFFKHYVFCLHQSYVIFKILGSEEELRAGHIPILGRWDEPTTPQMGELFDDIWKRTHEELGLSELSGKLATVKREVRRDELLFYLRLIHLEVISIIQRAWADKGLAPEEELSQLESTFRKFKPAVNSVVELVLQVEAELGNRTDVMFSALYRLIEGQRLKHKYIFRDAFSNPVTKNQQLLLLDFPSIYVNQLDKLLWPEWYAACFAKSYHNPSVWAHYGDGHAGVCLIFEAVESADGSSLELKRLTGRQFNAKGDYKEHWSYAPMYFQDVSYSERPATIDFLRNMGVLPVPALMKLWYTDAKGHISDCATHFTSGKEEESWRGEHWKDFQRDISIKNKDWEYEQECRLILHGLLDSSLDECRRALTYKFDSLKGIIFGIRTSDQDKLNIIDVIQRKCQANERSDFQFFQAYFSPEHADIRKEEILAF